MEQKKRPTVLGRTDSASWSRAARRKFNEACKNGQETGDTRIGPRIKRTSHLADFKPNTKKK